MMPLDALTVNAWIAQTAVKIIIPGINDKIIISAEGLSVKSENLAQIKNPQTSDNIIKYFIIGILSLVILAFIVVYFRKKTKVN